MSILRAPVRARGADREQVPRRKRSSTSARTSRRACRSATRSARAPEGVQPLFVADDAGRGDRRYARGRRCCGSPIRWSRRRGCAARSSAAMVYPRAGGQLRVVVMIALVTFVVPVFVNVFKQFPSSRTAAARRCRSSSPTWSRATGRVMFGGTALRVPFVALEKIPGAARQWDRIILRIPMKIGTSCRRSASRAGRARCPR